MSEHQHAFGVAAMSRAFAVSRSGFHAPSRARHGVRHIENERLGIGIEHIANGWPIGGGPVDGACKTIVKARSCQSGMRWSRQGGRNFLPSRVLNQSDQWDQAWQHYRFRHWQAAA